MQSVLEIKNQYIFECTIGSCIFFLFNTKLDFEKKYFKKSDIVLMVTNPFNVLNI